MASRTGSDELYRLIHSLNTEEKGHFVKFAKRQVAKGSQHLELFNDISRQPKFTEAPLKKKYLYYAIMKVYLKEIILNSLALYYRKHHVHISLFSLVEKIHLLVIKGMNHEALRVLEKALEQSKKMEFFSMTPYLLELHFELSKQRHLTFEDLGKELEVHKKNAHTALTALDNIEANKTLNENAYLLFSNHHFTPTEEFLQNKISEAKNSKVLSLRAEVKRASGLVWLHLLGEDFESAFTSGEQLIKLEHRLKTKYDTSFNTVPSLSNHIMVCIASRRFAQAEKLSNAMLGDKTHVKFYADAAFVRGVLSNLQIYFHTARFEKGLAEAIKHETALLEAAHRTNDISKPRLFYALKITFLFLNKKYAECWLCLHEHFSMLAKNEQHLPILLMLQLMTQLETGNYDMLRTMAVKAETKLKQKNILRPVYQELLRFFKTISPHNVRQQAIQSAQQIKKLQATNRYPVRAFNTLRYEHWLETKFSNQQLSEMVAAELKKPV